MKDEDIKLWRYALKSEKGGAGWAIFVLGSDGYFSAVSDFGKYIYMWPAHGEDDFRKFLAGAGMDPHYFIEKLSPGRVYDGRATKEAIKKKLNEQDTRSSMRTLRLLETEHDIDTEEGFQRWVEDDPNAREEYTELAVYEHPVHVTRFVKEVMPRLNVLMAKDLVHGGA